MGGGLVSATSCGKLLLKGKHRLIADPFNNLLCSIMTSFSRSTGADTMEMRFSKPQKQETDLQAVCSLQSTTHIQKGGIFRNIQMDLTSTRWVKDRQVAFTPLQLV